MKTLFALICFAITPAILRAQTATAYPLEGNVQWNQTLGFVPNSATPVTVNDTLLGIVLLANTTGGSVTVTMSDTTTNCSAGVCQFWPTISIAANTVYENNFGGMLVQGGVKWQASAATSVVGYMRGTYTGSEVAMLKPPTLLRRWLAAFLPHDHRTVNPPTVASIRKQMEQIVKDSSGVIHFPE